MMSIITIVVPVYHNAASLPDLLARLQALSDRNSQYSFEYIFVNDGSKDNSFEVLTLLRVAEPRMQIISLSRNFGSNPALMAGLSEAHGDAVAAISADLQDPPEMLDEMIRAWSEGHKVVLAARRERDDPGVETWLADTFYRLFRRFAIKTMPNRGFDFFLIDRQVCQVINSIPEQNPYLMGLILWVGFDAHTVYYDRQRREARYGRSMWTLGKKLKYFADAFVAFSYAPVRFASLLGFLVSVIGLFYAGIVLLLRLFGGVELEGWTSLMIVLLFVSGTQMLMLGILGEYIWRSLDETRKRPPFIVETKTDSMYSDNASEAKEMAGVRD